MFGAHWMDGDIDLTLGLPTVAVLPFSAIGAVDEVALIAHGLTEDVCGELTRFRSLRVIAPASSAHMAAATDAEIGARFGATHVLRGRLRASADGGRTLTADLSAAASQEQLWSERYPLPEGDPAEVGDAIIARIAATLSARIEEAGLSDARRRPADDLGAWQLTLRGLILLRDGTREANDAAQALFERALSRDPLYARAHAGLSLCWFNQWNCQFWDRFEEASRYAYQHARRALELDDRDAMSHLVIAQVALFHKSWEQAAWYVDRALALCPNDAELLVHAALLQIFLGNPGQAAGNVDRAMHLNPYHPSSYFGIAAIAAIFEGNPAKGLDLWERCDGFPMIDGPALAAAAYAHCGRLESAVKEYARFVDGYRDKIAFGQDFTPAAPLEWLFEVNPFRRPEDLAFLRDGFARIGIASGSAVAATTSRIPSPRPDVSLQHDGDGWSADFDGVRIVLPNLKGLHDIRRLMERPGEEIHCLDLDERIVAVPGEAILDEKARSALKTRLRDLQEDLAEAENGHDIGRAERLRDEMDRILGTLSAALGLGGRRRRLGDSAEKARTAVTWRIRHAIRRIQVAHPSLGQYLSLRVETGTFCRFRDG